MKDIRTLKTMFDHLMVILNVKQRSRMIGMFFVILIGSVFELLGVTAILPFIQAILTPDELMSKPYIRFFMHLFGVSSTISVLVMVGVGIIIVYIVKNVYLSFSAYLQTSYSNNIKRELSVLMLKSYMNRPYSFFVENGSGVILRGVSNDIVGVHIMIINMFKIATEGFVVVAIAIYLFLVEPMLTGGILITGLLCMTVIIFGIKKMLTRLANLYRDASELLGKHIMQVNGGIKDIMVFNRRKPFLEGYDKAYGMANTAETKSAFAETMPERIIETGCVAGIIIMMLIRIKSGVDANEFVPQMAVFAMGAFRLLPSISRLTGYLSMLIYARPMLEATYDNFVSARDYINEVESNISSDKDKSSEQFKDKIEIKDISWQYPQGKSKVLDGLSLTIKRGEAIGIIGESGSGKSTLSDLILRLYKPQSGGILMDGTDISTIPNVWSRVMSYVPQSVFLMDDTIRANVVFGAEEYKEEDIWEALRKASLYDFVMELPNKLDTIVGERGVKFSGGQRQRIAIARALYNNPQIIILDEATSALDNETEEAVMDAIDSLAGSITLIIIAHRVTTLKNCDKIYEIVGGKAVERDKESVINV